MTWSPFRHSENLNAPLKTVGAVFSGAVSISSFELSVTYLPKTWVGNVYPLRSMIAGQLILVSLTENFFGLALSIFTPEISFAVPVHPDEEEPTQ